MSFYGIIKIMIKITEKDFELILTYLIELRNKTKDINLIKFIEKLKCQK